MLTDPIKMLQAIASRRAKHPHEVTAAAVVVSDVPYEIPLAPQPGASVRRLTIASGYRTPIPVLYEQANRTTYPISSKG